MHEVFSQKQHVRTWNPSVQEPQRIFPNFPPIDPQPLDGKITSWKLEVFRISIDIHGRFSSQLQKIIQIPARYRIFWIRNNAPGHFAEGIVFVIWELITHFRKVATSWWNCQMMWLEWHNVLSWEGWRTAAPKKMSFEDRRSGSPSRRRRRIKKKRCILQRF